MRGFLAALVLCAGAARADVAAITSQNADAVTLLDTETLQVLATVPLPGKPAPVAVDGVARRAYVVAVETARLHVLDLDIGKSVADWHLDGAPFGVAVWEGSLLVTDQENALLLRLDPATGKEVARWKTGAMPSGVAAEGEVIVVADRDADQISVIRGGSVTAIPVGHHPFGVTLHQGRAFVTDVLSDQVSVVDLVTDKIIATIPTASRPYAVAFAAGKGFVTNQYDASLTVFDAETLQVLGRIETDEYPEGIAATSDGKILVANWFSDSLQVIDPGTMEVTETLDMPQGPRAFGLFTAP